MYTEHTDNYHLVPCVYACVCVCVHVCVCMCVCVRVCVCLAGCGPANPLQLDDLHEKTVGDQTPYTIQLVGGLYF